MEERIVKLLDRNGINATPYEATRNGVTRHGIRLGENQIAPILYLTDDLASMTDAEIMELVNSMLANEPQLEIDKLIDAKFIYEHCRIVVGKPDPAPTYKIRTELGIEGNIYVDINSEMGYRISEELANRLDTYELYCHAKRNTESDLKIINMATMLGLPEEIGIPMYVITNSEMKYGASALLFPEIFRDFCLEHGCSEIEIIPSSVHELIVIPANEFAVELDPLIASINSDMVDEVEQLADHHYKYSLETGRVTY